MRAGKAHAYVMSVQRLDCGLLAAQRALQGAGEGAGEGGAGAHGRAAGQGCGGVPGRRARRQGQGGDRCQGCQEGCHPALLFTLLVACLISGWFSDIRLLQCLGRSFVLGCEGIREPIALLCVGACSNPAYTLYVSAVHVLCAVADLLWVERSVGQEEDAQCRALWRIGGSGRLQLRHSSGH